VQQVTWRAPEGLLQRVKAVAARQGYSMNEFLTRVLDAATDPDLAGTEAERVRERLGQAGVLVVPTPVSRRPDSDQVAGARRRVGAAASLADIVSRDRG
jgi:hypothetical protein